MIAENLMPSIAEYGTPAPIADACRALLGAIDLDPCSSIAFNQLVRASYIYTDADNGIEAPWGGRVYLNPPGGRGKGRPKTKHWWQRLESLYSAGTVQQACYLSFALDSFQWSQVRCARSVLEFPTFIFAKRVKFFREIDGQLSETKAPNRPAAVHWLPPSGHPAIGPAFSLFAELLRAHGYAGRVVLPG